MAPSTAPFAVTAEGTTTVYFWSADAAGNGETTGTATVRIDRTAPVTTATVTPATWSASPATVTLSATDATSGVATTRYRIGTGSVTTYTAPFAVSAQGTTTVYFWSVDVAGNTESTKTATAYVDSVAPTGTMLASGGAAYTATRTVTVDSAVTDLTGLQMRVDPGTGTFGGWFAYAASVTTQVPSGDGTKTVRAEYRDLAGNVTTLTDTIILDTTTPSTLSDAPAGWSGTTVTVTLSRADALSGVAWTRYRIGSGTVTTYTVPFAVSSAGTTTVCFWSCDGVGNVEATQTATVRIDRTAPSTTHQVPSGWRPMSAVVTLTASDSQAGVASTWYRIGSGAAQPYASPFAVTDEGTVTVSYWSVDA
ncbi:hypothetical protein FDZ71_13080, partial [bacterium]